MARDAEQELMPLRFPVLAISAAPFVMGLCALAGWVFHDVRLSAFGQGLIPMAPSTALMFLMYGAAGLISVGKIQSGNSRRAIVVLALAGLFITIPLLVLSGLGIYLNIESLGFFAGPPIDNAPQGHMSPFTALFFVFAGIALLLSARDHRPAHIKTAFCLTCTVAAASCVFALAYLIGAPLFYGGRFIPPALPTVLAFLCLGAALAYSQGWRLWPLTESDDYTLRTTRVLAAFFLLLVCGIVTAGFLYSRSFREQYREKIEQELLTVADLKAGELVRWRKERLGGASLFHRNENFSMLVSQFLDDPGDKAVKRRLYTWLDKLRTAYDYYRVCLYDIHGADLLSSPERREPFDPACLSRTALSVKSGNVLFRDFYRDEHSGKIFLAIHVPIMDRKDPSRVIAVLAMRIDPRDHLYPMLDRWPTPSRTAETTLVRREDDHALFLNDLRFKNNAALNVRVPLRDTERLSVKAVLGAEGIVQGVDYHGQPVAAAVRRVPDSPWILISRINSSEIYETANEKLWILTVLIGALIAGAGTGVGMAWRQQRINQFRERLESLDELREAEERYHGALDSMMEGCQILGFDWRYLYINDTAAAQGRRTRDDLIGRSMLDIYPGIENTDMFAALKRCMETRASEMFQSEFDYPDGSKAWFDLSVQPVPEGLLILSNEITGRIIYERQEQLVRDVLELFNRPYGSKDTVREILRLIKESTGIEAIGFRLREGDDFPYYETSGFSEDFVLAEKNLCQCGENGEIVRDEQGNPVLECMCGNILLGRTDPSMSFFTQDGSFWSNCTTELLATTSDEDRQTRTRNRCNGEGYESVALIPLRSGGETIGLLQLNDRRTNRFTVEMIHFFQSLGASIGIALSRKRAEERIAHLNRVLRAIRDVNQLIVREKDPEKLISDTCALLVEHRGYESALIILENEDGSPRTHAHQGLADATMAAFLEDLQGSNPPFCCAQARGHQGSFHIRDRNRECGRCAIAMNCEPREAMCIQIQHSGVTFGYLMVSVHKQVGIDDEEKSLFEEVAGDIAFALHNMDTQERIQQAHREKKRIESELQQAQKMESVGRLAGGIAHDFNNMLTVIINYAEFVLLQLGENDPLRQDLEQILQAGQRSADLTRHLLAFSRKQVLAPANTSINRIVANIEKMIRRLFTENIELQTRLAPDLWTVFVDPHQIEQVIMNLAINARDAMPSGGKLIIETVNASVDEHYAAKHPEFTPGEYAMLTVTDTGCGIEPLILDRIFDPFFTTKPRGKGTGLGLSTVHGIVRQSGGHIWVYSEPGKGTSFKIHLPRADQSADIADKQLSASAPSGGTETILVVEDESIVRGLIQRVLADSGYTVHAAASAEDAIMACERNGYSVSLLITDVVMPGMSGPELSQQLLQINPDLKTLFISGYTENSIVHHGVLDDNIQFLPKPFSITGLMEKVRTVLDAK